MISLEEVLEALVELVADKLGPARWAAFLALDGRSPRAAGAALVDAGAVVVDVGVELHVSHHRHVLPLEHLLDALSEVAPDLVQVVVLLGRVRASMGSTRHLEPADDSFVD